MFIIWWFAFVFKYFESLKFKELNLENTPWLRWIVKRYICYIFKSNSSVQCEFNLNFKTDLVLNHHYYTLKEHQKICEGITQVSDLGFPVMVCEQIYLEAYIHNQYIWLRNYTAQLYLILGRRLAYIGYFPVYLGMTMIWSSRTHGKGPLPAVGILHWFTW